MALDLLLSSQLKSGMAYDYQVPSWVRQARKAHMKYVDSQALYLTRLFAREHTPLSTDRPLLLMPFFQFLFGLHELSNPDWNVFVQAVVP